MSASSAGGGGGGGRGFSFAAAPDRGGDGTAARLATASVYFSSGGAARRRASASSVKGGRGGKGGAAAPRAASAVPVRGARASPARLRMGVRGYRAEDDARRPGSSADATRGGGKTTKKKKKKKRSPSRALLRAALRQQRPARPTSASPWTVGRSLSIANKAASVSVHELAVKKELEAFLDEAEGKMHGPTVVGPRAGSTTRHVAHAGASHTTYMSSPKLSMQPAASPMRRSIDPHKAVRPSARPRTAARRGSGSRGASSVLYAMYPNKPGQVVVYRNAADKKANPERLSLDGQNLTACPVLEGEEELRLLNYENNFITKMSHLDTLPHLIFLDLYHNNISVIEGLENVPCLRVLMLGKNRLTRISGLEHLPELDVLDLHNNRIVAIENVGHLNNLRVLNLAGNAITKVENLDGLHRLSELNLRRNEIRDVVGLDSLRSLERVFLSNNFIDSLQQIRCLFSCLKLTELALDSNPIAFAASYRADLIERVPHLRLLDLRVVTNDERRQRSLIGASADGAGGEREEDEEAAAGGGGGGVAPEQKKKDEVAGAVDERDEAWGSKRANIVQRVMAEYSPERAAGGERPQEQEQEEVEVVEAEEDEAAVFYKYDRGAEALRLHGGAFEALLPEVARQNKHLAATSVLFEGVPLGKILPHLPRLKRFSKLASLSFADNGIDQLIALDDINLAAHAPGVTALSIGGDNPVCDGRLLRPYVIIRFPSIKVFNGKAVSLQERAMAEKVFGKLRAHWNNPLLALTRDTRGSSGSGSNSSRHKHRKAARAVVKELLADALATQRRLERLNEEWPVVVADIVRETLRDLADPKTLYQRMNEELEALTKATAAAAANG